MTKEDYIKEGKLLEDQISDLNNKREKLSADYIEEHKRFDVGDKVELFYAEYKNPFSGKPIPARSEFAYVKVITVYEGAIHYRFWKAKKDGSKSSHELHSPHYSKIELIEKANP